MVRKRGEARVGDPLAHGEDLPDAAVVVAEPVGVAREVLPLRQRLQIERVAGNDGVHVVDLEVRRL